MKFQDLAKNIVIYKKDGKEFTTTFWPGDIALDSSDWNEIKRVEAFTNKEYAMFKKQSGAVGWEYALNIIFFIDKIYYSKPVSGNYSSVNVNQSIKTEPIYSDKNEYVTFKLQIGDKEYTTQRYKTLDLQSGVLFGRVGILHTHPKFYHSRDLSQYSFFSLTDINSLVYGDISIMGLIAGRSIWLACKNTGAQLIPNELLSQASQIELNQGQEQLKEFVKGNMQGFNITFYHGTFGSKLRRI